MQLFISKNSHHCNCNPFHRFPTRCLHYYTAHCRKHFRQQSIERESAMQNLQAHREPFSQTRPFSMVFPIYVYDDDSFPHRPMMHLTMIR